MSYRFVSVDSVDVATWASIECEKQQSGERSVGRMVEAWHYAWTIAQVAEQPTLQQVRWIGYLLEPEKNRDDSFRKVNVRVGWVGKPPDWPQMDRLMRQWMLGWPMFEPPEQSDDFYREFEEIHPFVDGNGRAGNILWNWHRGTLEPQALEFPPDFWGAERLERDDDARRIQQERLEEVFSQVSSGDEEDHERG